MVHLVFSAVFKNGTLRFADFNTNYKKQHIIW